MTGVPEDGRLFLSHSSKDERLADIFLDLLTGAGLSESRIFYSSVRATGIESGQPVEQVLREQLQRSSFVVQLISPSFMASPMCLMELGAAWVLDLPRLPIVVTPLARGDVSARIGNFQMAQLSSAKDVESMLDDCYDALSARLAVAPSQSAWRRLSSRFTAQLDSLETTSPAAPGPPVGGSVEPQPHSQSDGDIVFSDWHVVRGQFADELIVQVENTGKRSSSGVLRATFYSSEGSPVASEPTSLNGLGAGRSRPVVFSPVPEHARIVFTTDVVF